MSSLHHQVPPRDLARSNTSVVASQAEEPMLTLLALLAPEPCCTSQAEEPMLTLLVSRTSPTSRGTNVDLSCLRVALLHLTLNLDERLSYMATLRPSSTHVATSLVAKISVVHQTPKPKQHI